MLIKVSIGAQQLAFVLSLSHRAFGNKKKLHFGSLLSLYLSLSLVLPCPFHHTSRTDQIVTCVTTLHFRVQFSPVWVSVIFLHEKMYFSATLFYSFLCMEARP